MATAPVAGIPASPEFTSFLRLEWERVQEDLERLKAADPATLKNKQVAMLAFEKSDLVDRTPGGLPNIEIIRAFKTPDGKITFEATLKYSEKILGERNAAASRATTLKAKPVEPKVAPVATKPEIKVTGPVTPESEARLKRAQERRERKKEGKQGPQKTPSPKGVKATPKPEPKIEYRPAVKTGRVVVLPPRTTYHREQK